MDTTTMTAWRDAGAEALGILLPVECAGCGADDRAVCAGCRTELAATPPCTRLIAGVRLDAAFEYVGVARTLVLAVKVHGRLDVTRTLGAPTVRVLRRACQAVPGAVVLRVPSSPAGQRRRGFDPVVLLLARGGVRVPGRLRRERTRAGAGAGAGAAAGAGAGAEVGASGGVSGALASAGAPGSSVSPGSQKSRTAIERVEATVGSLRAVGVAGRRVVLVDDVVTTGVTMAEGIRAVRAAGGVVVRCVATASVEP